MTCAARANVLVPPVGGLRRGRRPGVDQVDAAGTKNRKNDPNGQSRLWKIVDRPNLFIKIPATATGLPASAVLAEEFRSTLR